MTQKSCAVGMRSAKPGNHLNDQKVDNSNGQYKAVYTKDGSRLYMSQVRIGEDFVIFLENSISYYIPPENVGCQESKM